MGENADAERRTERQPPSMTTESPTTCGAAVRSSDLLDANDCMLCWNRETKTVGVMKHPAHPSDWNRSGFSSDVGASSSAFRKMSAAKKALALITEGIWIIRMDKIPADDVFAALDRIKECHDAMRRDPFA